MEARALEAQLTAPGFASSMAAVLHSIPDTIAIRTILFEAPKIEQLDAPAKKTGQNTIAAARMGIRVQLDGFSTHNTAISDALNSLADARIFNHVRLEESRDATLNGVPLHQFQITFDMQQQSSRYAFSGN
ncbi:MAG TPA: PilN domain-containing protein [Phycisphaerales bacterium]|nr:PilN domain-containing protein [Phycisphaerales bacterium]